MVVWRASSARAASAIDVRADHWTRADGQAARCTAHRAVAMRRCYKYRCRGFAYRELVRPTGRTFREIPSYTSSRFDIIPAAALPRANRPALSLRNCSSRDHRRPVATPPGRTATRSLPRRRHPASGCGRPLGAPERDERKLLLFKGGGGGGVRRLTRAARRDHAVSGAVDRRVRSISACRQYRQTSARLPRRSAVSAIRSSPLDRFRSVFFGALRYGHTSCLCWYVRAAAAIG